MPNEEVRALQWAYAFLMELASRTKRTGPNLLDFERSPLKASKAVREEARRIIRHFPSPSTAQLYWRRRE